MISKNIFKAYDVRGKYPKELNEDAAFQIAAAVGRFFERKAKSEKRKAKLVIGYDARLSSPTLYKAVLNGLKAKSSKLKAIEAGLMTTPMLYFLVNKLKADGGIMVTASHNPKEYNGLKAVGKNARPISGKEILKILRKYENVPNYEKKREKISYFRNDSHIRKYADFLKKFLKPKRKLKVIFDCSNGTTGIILKELFRKRKVKSEKRKVIPIFINNQPNGSFPAHGPNPLADRATEQLKMEVLRRKADLGIIFDADGDRVFFVDNRGRFVNPNEIGYILMQLFQPPYVTGIVSSWRIKKRKAKSPCLPAGREKRKAIFISRVGHYFFKKLMRQKKASLGLEHSGHYYFKNFFYCDSGIFAAIQAINFVSGLKTDFAGWLDELPKYYRSGEINLAASDRRKVKSILNRIEKKYKNKAEKIDKLDGLTMEFTPPAGGWWFNLRPSNTEPLLRLNIEAADKKVLNKKVREMRELILLSV